MHLRNDPFAGSKAFPAEGLLEQLITGINSIILNNYGNNSKI